MLLAFDLDGTVLTEDSHLPAPIASAVLAAAAKGHIVTVLTGRQFGSAKPFVDQLRVEVPYSTNHGARVRDVAGDEIRRVLMDGAVADAVVASYIASTTIEFSCVLDDTLFVKDPQNERWDWVHASSRTLAKYEAGTEESYDKVIFHAGRFSLTETVHADVAVNYPDLHRYLWGDGYLELVPEGADKGAALAFIAQRLGVPRSEVVAFGDGSNDVTMLDWAGTGVAVGEGAFEGAVAVADERIAAPDEGGVADWIERNLL